MCDACKVVNSRVQSLTDGWFSQDTACRGLINRISRQSALVEGYRVIGQVSAESGDHLVDFDEHTKRESSTIASSIRGRTFPFRSGVQPDLAPGRTLYACGPVWCVRPTHRAGAAMARTRLYRALVGQHLIGDAPAHVALPTIPGSVTQLVTSSSDNTDGDHGYSWRTD